MPLESPSACNMYLFNLRIANHILIKELLKRRDMSYRCLPHTSSIDTDLTCLGARVSVPGKQTHMSLDTMSMPSPHINNVL